MQNFILLATLLTTSLAQYGAAQSSSSATATGSSSSAASTHTIKVGQTGIVFEPDTVTAAVGDVLNFEFFNSEHSVAQSDFSGPCKPMSAGDGGIYSGFPGGSKVFQVKVNSTDPMWLYCSEEGHCQAGMVMVVNQAGGDTLAAYKTAASSTSDSSAPANVQGGIVESLSAATASAAASASVSATSSAAAQSSSASSASAATASSSGAAGETIGRDFQMTGLAAGMAALVAWLM